MLFLKDILKNRYPLKKGSGFGKHRLVRFWKTQAPGVAQFDSFSLSRDFRHNECLFCQRTPHTCWWSVIEKSANPSIKKALLHKDQKTLNL